MLTTNRNHLKENVFKHLYIQNILRSSVNNGKAFVVFLNPSQVGLPLNYTHYSCEPFKMLTRLIWDSEAYMGL